MTVFTVYIIESVRDPDRYYIGYTRDFPQRLKRHNAAAVPSTAPFRPWRLRSCVTFTDPQRAIAFEKYLKSHSGRAFISKHL